MNLKAKINIRSRGTTSILGVFHVATKFWEKKEREDGVSDCYSAIAGSSLPASLPAAAAERFTAFSCVDTHLLRHLHCKQLLSSHNTSPRPLNRRAGRRSRLLPSLAPPSSSRHAGDFSATVASLPNSPRSQFHHYLTRPPNLLAPTLPVGAAQRRHLPHRRAEHRCDCLYHGSPC